jgi:hypothetical protein
MPWPFLFFFPPDDMDGHNTSGQFRESPSNRVYFDFFAEKKIEEEVEKRRHLIFIRIVNF